MTVQLNTAKLSKQIMFKNSEWGPESNASMIEDIRNFPSHFGGVIGDLIDATPNEMISRYVCSSRVQPWPSMRCC